MMSRETVAKWIKDMLPKKCMNCGSTKGLQYHHIVPVIFGGNNVPSNIAVLCTICHQKVHFGKHKTIDHGECVRKGLENAKAKGVKLGRKFSVKQEEVMRLIATHSTQFNDLYDANYEPFTEHEIMEMAGLKEVSYNKYKRKLLEAINSAEWPFQWPKPKILKNRPLYDHCIKELRGAL